MHKALTCQLAVMEGSLALALSIFFESAMDVCLAVAVLISAVIICATQLWISRSKTLNPTPLESPAANPSPPPQAQVVAQAPAPTTTANPSPQAPAPTANSSQQVSKCWGNDGSDIFHSRSWCHTAPEMLLADALRQKRRHCKQCEK